MPALLTRMSSRPCRATMSPGSRSTAAASVTSSAHAPRPCRPAAHDSSATVPPAWSPRAAATTVAPCAASCVRDRAADAARRAGHERDLAGQIEHVGHGFTRAPFDGREIVGAAEAHDRRLAVDLADQAAQHRAGTHLNIRCDALRRKAPHDGLPAHRRRHLRDERLDRRRARRASARRRRWRRSARAESCDRERAQLGRQPLLGRLHQRAVERRAHRQRNRRAWRRAPWRARRRAPPRRARRQSRPGRRRSGSPGSRPRPPPPRRTPARPARRRAREWRPSRPRRPAPPPACSGRGGARCAARRRTRRCRPRRSPSTRRGCGRRRTPARSPRDASSRHAAMLTARIAGCVFSVSVSRSSGPSKHEAAERLAERRVGLGERLAADRERVGQRLAHADLLRALSGKDECDHCVRLPRRRRSPARRAR